MPPSFESPTTKDINDASALCFEREKLLQFNRGLRTHKHIVSHFNVEIHFNQQLNNTNKLQSDNNIYVRIKGTSKMCEQVRCNTTYPRGKQCKPDTKPMVYKSGYTDVFACESSCFNLYNKNSEVLSPLTRFSKRQNLCLLHNNQPYSMATDDHERADTITPRVSTIGTGCEVDANNETYLDFAGNETFKFTNNHFYCDDFEMEFKDGECVPSTSQKINDLFFSAVLYKAIQYGIRKAQTGVGISEVQKVVLEPIKKIAQTRNEWLNDYNKDACFFDPNLTLSSLGITADKRHLFFTTEFGWPGRLVEPIIFIRSPTTHAKTNVIQQTSTSADPNLIRVDFTKNTDHILPQFKYDERGRRYHDEFEMLNVNEFLGQLFKNDEKNLTKVTDKDPTGLTSFITGLPTLIQNPEFWLMMGTNYSNQLIDIVRTSVTNSLVRLQRKTATKTISTIIRRSIITTLVSRAGMIGRRMAAISLKLFASALRAASIVGVIGDVIGIIDLFFILSDPFKLSKLQSSKFLDTFSEMDLMTNELNFGYKTVEYSPAYFFYQLELADYMSRSKMPNTQTLFDDDVLYNNNALATDPQKRGEFDYMYKTYKKPAWAINLNELGRVSEAEQKIIWQSDYLFALSRNSNGLLINWHLEKGVCTLHEFNKFIDRVYDPQSIINYKTYIHNAHKRVDLLFIGSIIVFLMLVASAFITSTFFPLYFSMLFAIGLFSTTFSKF